MEMSEKSVELQNLERRLRAGLAGLPRPDVDDLIDETRSHISEQVADGATEAQAVAAYGDPAVVAREIIERRLAGEYGPVRPAGRARRIAAGLADIVIGWGPLVLSPIWLVLLGVFVEQVLMSPEQIADITRDYGYTPTTVHPALIVLTIAFLVWGIVYWRVLRPRSVSVGMRMAGISRLNAGDSRVVVRTIDLAESEPARIVARSKWYVAAPVALLGLVVAAAIAYFGVFIIGSVMQPWDFVTEAAHNAEDFERTRPVIESFYDDVIEGDVGGAQSLATSQTAGDVEALVERAKADAVSRMEVGESVGPQQYIVHEYPSPGTPRTVMLTVERFDEQDGEGTFTTVYRIAGIELDPLFQ